METLLGLFQYDFVIRGLVAGCIIAIVAPLIGIFLVLRRYSLIADTLAHVSLAGIAFGLLTGLSPLVAAIGASIVASLGIEHIRSSQKIYAESILALFLSGSLALAVILLSAGRGFGTHISSYLFGSILTVTQSDIYIVCGLAVLVCGALALFFKELVYISFDEISARASGISVSKINMLFIVLTACTISLSIPIVGALLVSALIVIPVVTALQLKTSFVRTIFWAECFSLCSVLLGAVTSFVFNFSTGGTIVLISIALFLCTFVVKKLQR